MKRFVLTTLLMASGMAGAQVATSGPGTEPATQQVEASTAPITQPVAGPATLPETMPVAAAGTMPSTFPTTQARAATTSTAPSSYASTEPTTRTFGSSFDRYSRRDFRSREAAPTSTETGRSFVAKPITSDFRPVLRRSIFVKGSQIVHDTGEPRSLSNDVAIGPTSAPIPAWSPETMLVFNGAAREQSGRVVAFIENTGMNQITRYQVGDAIAQGKVAGVTLDTLDYQTASRTTHVRLGQNLLGVDTQVLTTQPVASGSTPTTSPGSAPSSGGSSDSVLEKLRQRRLKELGGR